jgi:predicted phage baseplate assembly protein
VPLQPPNLDDRTFDELVRQAELRIPRYTPEWTDFNRSDPGATLVDLFAWLTEMILYRLNQVPARTYIKFLQLLNLELRPAQPATVHLTLTAQPGARTEPVPPGTPFGAQPLGGGDLLIFETVEGVDLIRVALRDLQVFDGAGYTTVTPANDAGGASFRPLGWTPGPGSALYLGFDRGDPPPAEPAFPAQMRFRVFLPAGARAGQPERCQGDAPPPASPVRLVWEYKPKKDESWRRLSTYRDESAGFTREGYLLVQGPATIEPTVHADGNIKEPRYWLRCRLDEGAYPTGREPAIDFLRPNVVEAVNLSTVRNELAGIGTGFPETTFQLRRRPVQADSLDLVVRPPGEEPEPGEETPWQRKDDLLASGPDDPHYVLNATTGEIRFGDREHGRIPPPDAEIVARRYRYGGGAAGNVGINLVTIPLTSPVGVESVTNERPAAGGRDEQPLERLMEEAPATLRHRNRAVSAADFAALAVEVGGVAKATAVALAHPEHPGVTVPGAVTVVVVPDTDDVPPRPSADLLRRVCTYLDSRRLLTTEVHIKGPTYLAIRVEARVKARPSAAFAAVEQAIITALNEHLSPLGPRPATGTGAPQAAAVSTGPRGWEFGRDLAPTSLYRVIQEVEDVESVSYLALRVDGQPWEDLSRAVPVPRDGLLYGAADHDITVIPAVDL